jgi:AbrB family looped-hinge helix DNA binding protein
MPEVTLSSKNQITLPAEIVRELRLQAGAKLVVELVRDQVVIVPKPASWTDYYTGRLQGVYGRTTAETDRYMAEERASWDVSASDGTRESDEAFIDLYHTDSVIRSLIQVFLGNRPSFIASAKQIAEGVSRVDGQRVDPEVVQAKLNRLCAAGWVRPMSEPDSSNLRFRLVRRIAQLPDVAA